MNKRTLTVQELDAQTAVELPDRDMMALVTIVITDVLNNLTIDIDVRNNQVAAQICAAVLNNQSGLTCEVTQN